MFTSVAIDLLFVHLQDMHPCGESHCSYFLTLFALYVKSAMAVIRYNYPKINNTLWACHDEYQCCISIEGVKRFKMIYLSNSTSWNDLAQI